MIRIGFLINPVAGMGGAVGLKGTDDRVEEAISRGAVPKAGDRATETLKALVAAPLTVLTCSDDMGKDSLRSAGIADWQVVYHPGDPTTADDTRRACREFMRQGVDLVVFCGGDGTARDVLDVVGQSVPIIGIPAGVKMYSAVFAVSPHAAADLITGSAALPCRDAEVVDIDEEAYRRGELSLQVYGYARVPYQPLMTQGVKVIVQADDDQAKHEIASFITAIMIPGTTYLLGAGSTTAAIADRLGITNTLLGVDAVRDGKIVAEDADEKTLLRILEKGGNVKIIVSPIGSQGFVLGRGNQQISADVVRYAGRENLIVVATPAKLAETPVLYIDTGDRALNRAFGDSISVICGSCLAQRKRLITAA